MKIPIALVLCLGAATHAAAQLQPYDVWRACQHPQAMDSSEYRRVREALSQPQRVKLESAHLEPDPKRQGRHRGNGHCKKGGPVRRVSERIIQAAHLT